MSKKIIEDEITKKEKKVLTRMLYNKEIILAKDFMEMRKVKKK